MPHFFAKPWAAQVGLYSWQILKSLALISILLFSAVFVTFCRWDWDSSGDNDKQSQANAAEAERPSGVSVSQN